MKYHLKDIPIFTHPETSPTQRKMKRTGQNCCQPSMTCGPRYSITFIFKSFDISISSNHPKEESSSPFWSVAPSEKWYTSVSVSESFPLQEVILNQAYNFRQSKEIDILSIWLVQSILSTRNFAKFVVPVDSGWISQY